MGDVTVLAAYILDLILGDPRSLPHPVRGMGWLIEKAEYPARRFCADERISGVFFALFVVGIAAALTSGLIWISGALNAGLELAVSAVVIYFSLSVKDLRVESMSVLRALKEDDLPKARIMLSRIVGRDTAALGEDEIVKAVIETVAESTSDGIIAPLFYAFIGGPVAAMAYKAVNTLDSMVGHKTARYLDFGWASARIDDIANYIPARITGLLIPVASFILNKRYKDSFRVMARDGAKHPSPNSGISEAAMAGALGIRLAGPVSYDGEVVDKPYIGDEILAVRPEFIREALDISLLASFVMVAAGAAVKQVVF